LRGERKIRNGKCLKWWVESFDFTIAYVSNAFTLGDKFSSLFTSSTCVRNFNHPLWVSLLCCVYEAKGKGIKEIEITMFNKNKLRLKVLQMSQLKERRLRFGRRLRKQRLYLQKLKRGRARKE
jgi:hypothetical protein